VSLLNFSLLVLALFLARPSDSLSFPRPSNPLFPARLPDLPFLACPSACSSPELCPGLGANSARRSVGWWFTATSSASSSSATT